MLHVALKEWSVVCDLLMEGRLAILLRKGGIHEDRGPGEFRLEHDRFALFPSWAHQKPEMIKPPFRDRVRVMQEPAEIPIGAMAAVGKIWQVPGRTAFDKLDDLHCWTRQQVDMRFDYKPDHPLYLVAVRCYPLAEPKNIPNHWSYGGCKSWVPLQERDVIDDAGARPVIGDEAFAAIIRRVDEAMR